MTPAFFLSPLNKQKDTKARRIKKVVSEEEDNDEDSELSDSCGRVGEITVRGIKATHQEEEKSRQE